MSMQIESDARKVLTQYPVKRAALFGSAARGGMTENSDVDMLVEFLPDTRGLDFFGLKTDLEEILNRSVDLITWNALHKSKPEYKQNIERDARLIYEQ